MPTKLTRTLAALGVLALCGCEVIAGIKDLQLTLQDDAGSGAPGDALPDGADGAGASLDGPGLESSTDATTSGTGDGGSPADGADAGGRDATVVDGNGGEAATDATADSLAADAAGGSTPDGNDAARVAEGGVDAGPDALVDGGSVLTELIDDMEGTNPVGWIDGVNASNPRAGNWFTFSDPSAGGVLVPPQGSATAQTISVIPGGRGSSVHAAHVVGNSGFTAYGAGMGFNLNAPVTVGVYDASAYQGFAFWARSLGDAGTTTVRFNVLDRNTAPPASGGVCDGGACSGYFGFNLIVTSAWQLFTVHYADLTRPIFALPDGLPFDPAHMIGCQFQVSPGVAFDLWIDDISFIDN